MRETCGEALPCSSDLHVGFILLCLEIDYDRDEHNDDDEDPPAPTLTLL